MTQIPSRARAPRPQTQTFYASWARPGTFPAWHPIAQSARLEEEGNFVSRSNRGGAVGYVARGDLIASGVLNDESVIERPPFGGTIAELAQRMRDGRAYVNLHTQANPGGEVRGPIVVTDRKPVSRYSDPEFSWKFEVAPAAVGFMAGTELGPQYNGNMFVGGARPFIDDGHLFRFRLAGNRRKIAVDDPRLEDRVADNAFKFDTAESETLLFGSGFGVATDIKTGPNGNLYVVSLTNGAIYEISRKK